MPALTNLATKEFLDPAIKEMADGCEENARTLEELTTTINKKIGSNAGKKLPAGLKKTGRGLGKESKKHSKSYRAKSGFLKKAGKFLKMVDFVSSGAKVAGYLAEGDMTGASGVFANEASKKLSAAGGAAALSWIPVVGQTSGAAAGEEFHNNYVRPEIEKRENDLRDSEYKDKYLNKPWLAPTTIMDSKGNVRELPSDMYFDRDSNLVKRRSTAEQKAYEQKKFIEYKDAKKLNRLIDGLAKGDISEEEYDEALDDYRNRDKSRPWEPPSWLEESEAAEEEEEASEAGDGSILNYVKPIKLTAKGSDETDLSAGEFENVATTTVTISFWNVGNMAPGYGNASVKLSTEFSGHPAVEKDTCGGTFSGGPNGSFTIECHGETQKMSLVNGSYVDAGDFRLAMSNPGAFKDWPGKF
ncbi:MAG: hypothetical protein LC660_10805 [Desulfobacteraceae bacterium]|nr:hypothetical protein [Desulfobacteraceae bacterium]